MHLKIFVAIPIISCVSCTREDGAREKVMEFNGQREIVGIPVIPNNWGYKRYGRFLDFVNPVKVALDSRRAYKRVFIRENGKDINWEMDSFLSGKKFHSVDGEIDECINVYYYFSEDQNGIGLFKFQYTADFGSGIPFKEVTMSEANRLLVDWGIDFRYR